MKKKLKALILIADIFQCDINKSIKVNVELGARSEVIHILA